MFRNLAAEVPHENSVKLSEISFVKRNGQFHTLVYQPQREGVVWVFQRLARNLFDQEVESAVSTRSRHI